MAEVLEAVSNREFSPNDELFVKVMRSQLSTKQRENVVKHLVFYLQKTLKRCWVIKMTSLFVSFKGMKE